MNASSDRVLRYLAGNENLENISINELQKLADENPYFPVAQFLLAKKLKAEYHSAFLPQVQKTALYFSNLYWLHYQLSNESWQKVQADENDLVGQEIGNASSEIAELSENKMLNAFFDKPIVNEPLTDDEGSDRKGEKTNEHLSGAINKEEVEIPDITDLKSSGIVTVESVEKASQPEEEIAALVPEPDTETELFLERLDNVVQEATYNENEEILPQNITPAKQETGTNVLEEMAGVTHEADEATEVFLNETPVSPEESTETTLTKTPIPPFTSDISKNENGENTEPDEHERMFQNIKAMLDATIEEADADIENAVIPIDPYYTIDYFASQGIKLEIEQNPKDQLGQHLKKFTQWLKHMKKLGPEDAAEVIKRTDAEADIQKIAESSNTAREVVTEAMASVLEKQGKNGKAIELYKKLSFLNPHKSAYFADKIKNLKGI